MRSDLDRLMAERGFDAIIIMGHAAENYPLQYLTGGAPITEGLVIQKRGQAPLLIVGAMEREEAARSGLPVRTYSDFNLYTLIKETGSYFEGRLQMMAAIFEQLDIHGVVSFYGAGDPGHSFMFLSRLGQLVEGLTVTGETETSIFDEAFTTKDEQELRALQSVAERTNRVMAETIEFLRGRPVRGSQLIGAGGAPLTVGEVKRFARARLLEHQLEEADGMIFAVGRDGGVPHSRGEDADVLELGQAVVFDLFPRELGGGYFHDMTRTFCLGYAPTEVQRAYDQVMLAFSQVMNALAVGEKTARYQEMACDLFEEMGHTTIRSDPAAQEGYVHSLGHGLGLEIHARPRFASVAPDIIQPGQVFTIEPGLYYPSRGFGVRIEDTIYVDSEGRFHSLTPFPRDLVIPMRESGPASG